MSLSRKHLSSGRIPLDFDVNTLGRAIQSECPLVLFAFLLGSSKDGHVQVGSDIDIALYVEGKASWDLINQVMEIVGRFAPGVRCDVGILNGSEPVYRFEALKGQLLFVRNRESYLNFFSLACREYERQMSDYGRQRAYRIAVREGIGT